MLQDFASAPGITGINVVVAYNSRSIHHLDVDGIWINMNKIITGIFIGLFLFSGCSTQTKMGINEPIEMTIIFYGNNQREFLRNFILYKNHDTEIINTEYYMTIRNINKKILLDILMFLNLKLDIMANNIANANTTRTIEGGALRRNYLNVSIERGVEIRQDTKTSFRHIYDPFHPDAILDGVLKGFVVMPNVDIQNEKINMVIVADLYSSILNFAQNNFRNIIW